MLENLLCLLYASDLPYFFLTALCPDLSNPANGTVSQSGNSEGDTGNYTCNAGYELAGAPVLNCQADGTWDNPPPTCRRTFFIKISFRANSSSIILFSLSILTALCPVLPDPANGVVTLSGRSEGDTAAYSCNNQYELVGAPILNCQSDGTWDNLPPVCQIVEGKKNTTAMQRI